jgi:hypothetical protein
MNGKLNRDRGLVLPHRPDGVVRTASEQDLEIENHLYDNK